jgi:cysteinyl-tRNA synthetase
MLHLYNTLTRQKEPFEPLEPGQVRMYVCGVTVYDYCHLGHARSYTVWDVVRRYLLWRGYAVTYVQNFTDIDDKIIRRSQQENQPWHTITETYSAAYLEDMARLNILPADAYPKATESIPQIIELIQLLIDRGVAYPADGDVYYAVERFPGYGKLSGRKLEQMEAGASGRVDDPEDSKKRHPLDFALWKAAKPGEPEWTSPWGQGRPGWHIECSAMVRAILGEQIDIHTGGEDLIFPHHENEIAQSEAALAQPLARYWLHNGFVKIRGDKMSKSLKNFTTIRTLLENTDPMVLRLFVLQAHYRSPIDFTDAAMAGAENSWNTLVTALGAIARFAEKLSDWPAKPLKDLDQSIVERFNAAMDDDFNTPVALSVLFELAKEIQREHNLLTHKGAIEQPLAQLHQRCLTFQTLLSEALGFKLPNGAADGTQPGYSDAEIEALIEQRQQARQAKNFAEGDRIRDQLAQQGIKLIDKPGGITNWDRD